LLEILRFAQNDKQWFPDGDYLRGVLLFGGFGQMAKGRGQQTAGSKQQAEKS
jgi:hypothetical protein